MRTTFNSAIVGITTDGNTLYYTEDSEWSANKEDAKLFSDQTKATVEFSKLTKNGKKAVKGFRRIMITIMNKNQVSESAEDDFMNGHQYYVSGASRNVVDTGSDYNLASANGYYDDPKKAIIAWLRANKEMPTYASIDTNKNKAADILYGWVQANEEEFRSLCDKYKCPYKVDYLVYRCGRGRNNDFERSGYPDQISPFSAG